MASIPLLNCLYKLPSSKKEQIEIAEKLQDIFNSKANLEDGPGMCDFIEKSVLTQKIITFHYSIPSIVVQKNELDVGKCKAS